MWDLVNYCSVPLFLLMGFKLFVVTVPNRLESMVAVCMLEIHYLLLREVERWREYVVGRWREYKEIRREYGRHHGLASVALDAFIQVNYRYKNFVRNNQCLYEGSIIGKFVSAPKLFHSYITRRKKGCPSIGPLRSEYGGLCPMLLT